MFDFASELPGLEPQARKRDPAGLNAVSGRLLQVPERVVHQQGPLAFQFALEVWPQNIGGFGPPGLVNHHVFNRDDGMQVAVQAHFLAQGHGVSTGGIGQHDAQAR